MLSTERSRQGPLAERLREENTSLVYLVCSGICLGKVLSWGWRLRSGRLAGGLELPNYLVLFLSWRTKVNARFCLPFLLRLKAVRCEGGRFFSFCHLGEWSCLLSTLSLILHYHYSKKRKLEGHLLSLLLFTNSIHSPPTWQYFLDFCDIPNIWISRKEQENDSLF